ncbi:tetratricopeptide repeat protein [Paraflavitalea speifideaquila]|uniref:tetratricopeptide repeat protein n=1 Tax=Paraflavitalea speifideaquila TaxID=3076558 RepID=UPI0028EBF250|nr:tetratricopeptide repeat protein [Paraflavitalea speifideiaquila]
MATVNQPTGQAPVEKTSEERVVAGAQQFWSKNSKLIGIALAVVVLLVGGYFAYNSFFKRPEELKAAEAAWKAEEYFRTDSVKLALNGDGINQGFLKVISKYGGTKTGNRAKFYAGACYLQLGDFNNAVKYLKDFSSNEVVANMRANGLLGDAYSELGKKEEAIGYYKKAGAALPEDEVNSPEYLFRAALLLQDAGKTNEAIELAKQVKNKYPRSIMPQAQGGQDIDKYLGKWGDTK